MIWSLYLTLGRNMWFKKYEKLTLEDEAWNKIVDKACETGINMIVLDLGEGVHYASHPELAVPDAWTRERIRYEVKRLKDKGIALIPKLNFSATHHLWLGEYRKMLSTDVYYRVCRDLIYEVYSLFDKPEFIHLGMDEEGAPEFFPQMDLINFRQGELLWHDLQYLLDCVRDTGAMPWIWGDLCVEHPEEFRKRVKPGTVVLSPWNYNALKEEHYTLIADNPRHVEYYSKEPYKHMNLTYVEEDPFCIRFMNEAVPAARDGYHTVPCVSLCFGCNYNPDDTVDYFTKNAPKETLSGFMTAPWLSTNMENYDMIVRNLEYLKNAREKYCG